MSTSTSKSTFNSSLPIAKFRNEIIESVRKHATTIIVGETGSGKSTQLPQYLQELLTRGKRIACTQPRRVAAVSVAQRVAYEQNVKIGDEVGYAIRFEDKSSHKTKIKFVTDGILLRECMIDSMLNSYDIVILDEAHERSLQTDILMGLLRQAQEKRPTLRVVVMSATLQTDLYMRFFKDGNVIKIAGRQFPVDVLYASQAVDDYVDAALLTCLQVHAEEEPGGVLVFLPGQEDIEALAGLLENHLPSLVTKKATTLNVTKNTSLDEPAHKKSKSDTGVEVTATSLCDFEIAPLYAAMSADDQMAALKPSSRPEVRKFVLSTNIAETSVTIAGIKYVIDTGFHKSRMLQSGTGIEMLKIVPVSQAQANQRAGRSGRECPGKCFRLYTEETYEDELQENSVPEIERVNISQVILQLKAIGVVNCIKFPYVTPPSATSLRAAFELLLDIGALDKSQNLTAHGKKIVQLPLEPHYAHLLLCAQEFGCVAEVLIAVSMLASDNVFLQPHREEDKRSAAMVHRRLASKEGDLPTLVEVFETWIKVGKDKSWASMNFLSQRSLLHANSVRSQLTLLLEKVGVDATSSCRPEKEPLLKALAVGLFFNAARLVVGKTDASNTNDSKVMLPNFKATSKFSDRYNSTNKKVLLSSNAISSSSTDTTAPYSTLKGGQPVHIHPSSVLFSGSARSLPQHVVFSELLITSKKYMRGVTIIDSSWLIQLPPQKRQLEKSIGDLKIKS